MDVGEDGLGKELLGAGVVDLVAEVGGADVVVEIGEEEEAGLFTSGVVELVVMWAEGVESEAGREKRGKVREVFAGAGGDDEGRGKRDFVGAAPVVESAEGVGAEEQMPAGFGRVLGAEVEERIDGVIRLAVRGVGSVGEGECEVGVMGDGEAGHGNAIFEGGGGAGGFERLATDGGEEDKRQTGKLVGCSEGLLGSLGDGEMAAVGRVEAASEEDDVERRMGGWGQHLLMVAEVREGFVGRDYAGSAWRA